jgi:IS5 family transposase
MQGRSDANSELLDAAALCRQLVPQGSVEAFLADHRKNLFPDARFEDLFPSKRGRPSIPADVVATVMVLQALEGLSDREATRALTDRISWKVACGLSLDHQGFDYSVLTYWRTRLRQSERPERVFEAVRSVVEATGVLRGKTKRALDSTLLDDAVATQDTVTQLVAQVRKVRRVVTETRQVPVHAHDYDEPGKPQIDWTDTEARAGLVHGLVADALDVLAATETLTLDENQADAVALLALVAGQDVECGEDGRWHVAQRVAKDRVISVVDPEARHMHKSRSEYRDGFKAHLAVEPETGLVTAARLTAANVADAKVALALLDDEGQPLTVLADGAYGPGETLAALEARGHRCAIKPYPAPRQAAQGFTRDDFAVDYTARTATCPAGGTVAISPKGYAHFDAHCRSCPHRSSCTSNKRGRKLFISINDRHLQASRRAWRDGDFISEYRKWRPMVERSISWLVAGRYRRVRFRGVERNQLGLSMRVAAINLRRLVNLGLEFDGEWRLAVT